MSGSNGSAADTIHGGVDHEWTFFRVLDGTNPVLDALILLPTTSKTPSVTPVMLTLGRSPRTLALRGRQMPLRARNVPGQARTNQRSIKMPFEPASPPCKIKVPSIQMS